MRCQYCGIKKLKGEQYLFDPRNSMSFCCLQHLREWGKRHTGRKYFRAITKTVQE